MFVRAPRRLDNDEGMFVRAPQRLDDDEGVRDGFERTLYLVRRRIAVELDALNLLKREEAKAEAGGWGDCNATVFWHLLPLLMESLIPINLYNFRGITHVFSQIIMAVGHC